MERENNNAPIKAVTTTDPSPDLLVNLAPCRNGHPHAE
jgi:hypothetical protein